MVDDHEDSVDGIIAGGRGRRDNGHADTQGLGACTERGLAPIGNRLMPSWHADRDRRAPPHTYGGVTQAALGTDSKPVGAIRLAWRSTLPPLRHLLFDLELRMRHNMHGDDTPET